MIKVNLLRDQSIRARKTAALPTISATGLALFALFLLLVGGLGAWWYHLHTSIEALTATRDRLREENDRMQALQREITEYEQLKHLHQGRIQVIEQLRENQTGPVSLLNHVIQSMPRDSSIWLTLLNQKEDRIQIKGHTLRIEAIPELMSNLSATGFFRSVDLELMEAEKDAVKFSLICMSASRVSTE